MKHEAFIIQYNAPCFFIWTTYKTVTKRLIKKLFEQIMSMSIAGISDPDTPLLKRRIRSLGVTKGLS